MMIFGLPWSVSDSLSGCVDLRRTLTSIQDITPFSANLNTLLGSLLHSEGGEKRKSKPVRAFFMK